MLIIIQVHDYLILVVIIVGGNNMANRPIQLNEVVVYPKSGKGAKSTNMGSYYDTMNTLTE